MATIPAKYSDCGDHMSLEGCDWTECLVSHIGLGRYVLIGRVVLMAVQHALTDAPVRTRYREDTVAR